MRSTSLPTLAFVLAATCTAACGSTESSGVPGGTADAATDAGVGPGADASDARIDTLVDAGPFCPQRDAASAPAAYFDMQIDGVTKSAGEVNVKTDTNGRVVVAGGFPTLTLGSTGSAGMAIVFTPGVGTWSCDNKQVAPAYHAVDYSYGSQPVTGAHSNLGSGACTMTIGADGSGSVVEGFAEGVLNNVTAGREKTFAFKACWRQPRP